MTDEPKNETAPAGLTTQPTSPAPTTPTTEVKPAGTTPTPETKPAETAKTEEPKKEEAAAAPVAAALTDLKLPEGFTLDEKTGGEFLSVVNDAKLSPGERAQKLLDMQIAREQAASENGVKAWNDLQEQWQSEVKNDPEIGGAKFDQTISTIGRLLDKYKATPELREALLVTGAGNNPHIVRFIHSIAKDVTEPGPVSGSPGTQSQSLAEKLYTKMGK